MDKGNVGIIDSLNNETPEAREPVNESHGSSHESKGKLRASRQAIHARGKEKKEP